MAKKVFNRSEGTHAGNFSSLGFYMMMMIVIIIL